MSQTTPPLPERYTEVERIGFGGMGDIFKAHDTKLGRTVAIKVLAERVSTDASLRQRFTREAIAAGGLSSNPHVVTIYDVGECDGQPFIVMEYLPGGTLREQLREGGIDAATALGWLRQAASALETAHAQGIVHRDVKPANLLLDARGEVHVGDFGIARVLHESTAGMTSPGTVLGTAGYLSPEQARGEPAGPASDRYALAVVAFELLTGRRPFARDSATAEAAAHVTEPVPAASSINRALPRSVDGVFERALAKDPDDRYDSPVAFVDDLAEAMADEHTVLLPAVAHHAPVENTASMPPPVVDGPDAGAPADGYRRAPRRRRAALVALTAAALAAVGAVGIAAGSLVGGKDPASERTPSAPQAQTAEVTTVVKTAPTRTITKTEREPAPEPDPAPTPVDDSLSVAEASALNDRAYGLMQQGRHAEAIPMLRRALPALRGAHPQEAYASYNLGASLIETGNCAEGLPLIDRSEQLQGTRSEFAAARAKCE